MRPAHTAGQPAPTSAIYEQINVFGTPTGVTVRVPRGHPLPEAPTGFNWTVAEEHPEDC